MPPVRVRKPKPRAAAAAAPAPAARAERAGDAYHHRDLRQTLIDVAVRVLRAHGTAHFTLRSLARDAGVSHAAPYAHFRDKTALLAEVAAVGFGQLTRAMRAAADDAGSDARARFMAIGGAYVRFGVENAAHYRLMFTTPELCGAGKPEIVERTGGEAFQVLIESLDALHPAAWPANPKLRPDALTAWSMVHGLTLLVADQRDMLGEISGPEAEQLARAASATLLDGLSDDAAAARA